VINGVEGCEKADIIVEKAEVLAEQAVLEIVARFRHDVPLGVISLKVVEPDRAWDFLPLLGTDHDGGEERYEELSGEQHRRR